MIDAFSNWLELVAVANIDAITISKVVFTNWISRFGSPYSLTSDRGAQFESKLFEELCKILNIHKIRTCAFHPQCNSKVERVIGSTKSIIRCIMATSEIEWDETLQYASFSYNSTTQMSTNFTPAMLMFGRELSLPVELLVGIPRQEQQFTPQNYVQQMKNKLINIFEIVRKNIGKAQSRQKQYFDEKSHFLPIKVDDLIFLKNHIAKSFQSPWTGPYKVLRVLNDKVLEIIPTDKRYR